MTTDPTTATLEKIAAILERQSAALERIAGILDRLASPATKPAAEPAPQPDADGWVPYNGGGCPVDHETMVEVRYRRIDPLDAFNNGEPRPATEFWWAYDNSDPSEIVAYRIHTPAKDAAK